MNSVGRFLLFLGVVVSSPVCGFTLQNSSLRNGRSRFSSSGDQIKDLSTTTSLRLTEAEIPIACLEARGDCVFWFLGASGAAGIAKGSLPVMFTKYVELQQQKDVGPTKGGETVGISPLCLYPCDLSRADVEQVVNNPLTVEQMVKKFPVEGLYLASRGFLHVKAFEQANANANPLAVRAVFDCFSISSDTAEPTLAQAKLDAFKKDLNAFKFNLLKSKVVGATAIVTLLFLLGLADLIAFSDLQQGWFPDWPGARNFPFGMFTEPNGSPFNIPAFWI